MTLTDPLNYGTDDITLFVVASKTNGTQDYMFGDAGVPAGAPSIISGYNGLDFEFFGSSPRVTFKDSGSVGLQLLAIILMPERLISMVKLLKQEQMMHLTINS